MLYFAYGSNMDGVQMKERCPSHEFRGTGFITDYRLDFTHYAAHRKGGAADIVPEGDARVWGVLYDISNEDIEALNRFEGMGLQPPVYRHASVNITHETNRNDSMTDAYAYEIITKSGPFKPSRNYMRHLLDGARMWGLPESYIAMLKAIQTP